MNYRNEKLLALAKGATCQIAVPGICNGDPTTTVAAHSNAGGHGKGQGIKAHDVFVAHACSACHDAVDGRSLVLEAADREFYWRRGFERTMLYLFKRGLVRVA